MSGMERGALAALVEATRERNQWSVRDVAEYARSRGENLSRTDVSNYGKQGMPTLVPRKLHALACGLRLPPHVVWFAALRDHGVEIPQLVRTPEEAIEQDPTLPDRTRRLLLSMLKQAREDG